MAEERVPPPLDDDVDIFANDSDDDGIFGKKDEGQSGATLEISADEPESMKAPTVEESSPLATQNGQLEEVSEEEAASTSSAEPLNTVLDDDSSNDVATSAAPVVSEPEPDVKPKETAKPVAKASQKTLEEGEEEDKFNIEITVTNPCKKGDGMNAYMVYQTNTVTNIPAFRGSQFAVTRRFSDFLGLYSKLIAKHGPKGIIVPKAPEKSTVGMAKVKMGKEESGSQDFIEKRRAALERFVNRTVAHPILRMDPDVRDFLTMDEDLPKASDTSALSAKGVMRLISKMGDAVSKMSHSKTEPDSWFEEKSQQIENLDIQMRKLHDSTEALVYRRHNLAASTDLLARTSGMVAAVEEQPKLAQVMSKLKEVEEKVQQIHEEQADSDFFTLSELLKDYLSQIGAVKDAFNERIKLYKHWKDCESTLTKKRESKVKLELASKTDKIPQAEAECKEWEEKVESGEKDFNDISETIKNEMARFDRKRVKDFKSNLINYLEKLMNNEEQLIKHWEQFLPEARSIA